MYVYIYVVMDLLKKLRSDFKNTCLGFCCCKCERQVLNFVCIFQRLNAFNICSVVSGPYSLYSFSTLSCKLSTSWKDG